MVTYSACEVATAAGYRVRRMPSGGVNVQNFPDGRRPLLEVGPEADVDAIIEITAARELLDLDGVVIGGIGLADFPAKTRDSQLEFAPLS